MADDDSVPPGDQPPHEAGPATVAIEVDRVRSPRFPLELLDRITLDDGPEWLIKGLLPSAGLAVLYGVSGTGKSFVALDAALHVAAGRPWMGRRVRQAGVVYIAAEAGRGFRKRIVAAVRHHRLPGSLPFALMTAAPHLGQRDGDAGRLAKDIAAQLPADFRPGLIVVDTLARTMAGCDESGTAGMGVFVENAEMLGRKLGALVLVVHHAGKDAERGMRGSSALLGAADAVLRIEADADRPAVRVEKLKDGADDIALPFELERVELACDQDGEPRSTCVVISGSALAARPTLAVADPAAPTAPPTPDPSVGLATFFDALTTVIAREGTTTRRFKHIPAEARVVRQADLADVDAFAYLDGSRKSRQSRIDRYIRELEATGDIARHGGYLWLARDSALTINEEKHAA